MQNASFMIIDLPLVEENVLEELSIQEQKQITAGSAIALGIFANNDAISGAGAGISGPTQIREMRVVAAPEFSMASIYSRYSPRFS